MHNHSTPLIRKPRVTKMPWRTSAPASEVSVRKVGEPVNVILAETHPDQIAAYEAPVGARGICGCGSPVTKVTHPTVNGGRPTWIHDVNPDICHMVANVRCVTR